MTYQLLFVDDDPGDAEIACWHLSKAGIRCDYRVVGNDLDMMHAIAKCMPQLVLADLVMPNFSAWVALRVLRQWAPAVPLVIYSGTVSVEATQLATQRGVFGWAEKDSPAQLVAVVRRALELP